MVFTSLRVFHVKISCVVCDCCFDLFHCFISIILVCSGGLDPKVLCKAPNKVVSELKFIERVGSVFELWKVAQG